jgi:hypothetical protein
MSKNLATPEQIAEWKATHLDVYKIEIPEDNKVCYLRKPTRQELSYASTAGTQDPMKFNEQILKNCWLGGDEEIKTNDSLFLAVSTQLDKVLEFKKAELEKL